MKDDSRRAEAAGDGLSRRQVLRGAAVAALAAGMPAALSAQQGKTGSRPMPAALQTSTPLRRTMAAAAVLGDGRVLVTGGYGANSPDSARALNSAMIFDPYHNTWTAAAPMNIARARHAATMIDDGRVLVAGGMNNTALGSVEVYNPATNTWQMCDSLAHPRFDHVVVANGSVAYVMGGSSVNLLSSVEFISAHPGR